MRPLISSALVCTLLGACSSGSGGGGSDTVTSPSDKILFGDDAPTVTRDAANDTYTVTVDGAAPIVFEGAPAFDRGAFDHAQRQSGGGYTSTATLGGGQVALFFPDSTMPTAASVIVEQAEGTTVPAVGAAIFRGDYAGGVFIDEALLADTSGDAQINVDFESDTVSGRITNRTVNSFDETLTNAEDIVLEEASISESGIIAPDGGVAMAGVLVLEEDRFIQSKDGEYTGLISGVAGAHALGGIEIEYARENGGAIALEFGAFAASQ